MLFLIILSSEKTLQIPIVVLSQVETVTSNIPLIKLVVGGIFIRNAHFFGPGWGVFDPSGSKC